MERRRLACSAPGRANLIGNPSDQYGGAVLSCSVDLRAWVTIESSEEVSLVSEGCESVIHSEADLALRGDRLDLGRAALAFLERPAPACRIGYGSAIPARSGMGGSSALMVTLLYALGLWRDRSWGAYTLAEAARQVERTRMNVVCGYVDQYMAAFGGLRYLDFRGKELDPDQAEPPFATVETLDPPIASLPFVSAFTGVRHQSGEVHAPVRERWLAGEPRVVSAYARITKLAGLGKRAFLTGSWRDLGDLMNENHAIQRELGGAGEVNERLIQVAREAGALGAKLAGAGNGGTIVALCADGEGEMERVEAALLSAGAAAIYRPTSVPGVRIDVG